MNGDLLASVNNALDTDSWDGAVSSVKQVMGRAIRELDETARLEVTNYFNHSFVPDYRITWPDPAVPDRDIYLRLGSSAEFIAGDLELIGDSRPIFIGLSPLEEGEVRELDRERGETQQSGSHRWSVICLALPDTRCPKRRTSLTLESTSWR